MGRVGLQGNLAPGQTIFWHSFCPVWPGGRFGLFGQVALQRLCREGQQSPGLLWTLFRKAGILSLPFLTAVLKHLHSDGLKTQISARKSAGTTSFCAGELCAIWWHVQGFLSWDSIWIRADNACSVGEIYLRWKSWCLILCCERVSFNSCYPNFMTHHQESRRQNRLHSYSSLLLARLSVDKTCQTNVKWSHHHLTWNTETIIRAHLN